MCGVVVKFYWKKEKSYKQNLIQACKLNLQDKLWSPVKWRQLAAGANKPQSNHMLAPQPLSIFHKAPDDHYVTIKLLVVVETKATS